MSNSFSSIWKTLHQMLIFIACSKARNTKCAHLMMQYSIINRSSGRAKYNSESSDHRQNGGSIFRNSDNKENTNLETRRPLFLLISGIGFLGLCKTWALQLGYRVSVTVMSAGSWSMSISELEEPKTANPKFLSPLFFSSSATILRF